jgi:uncharacterized membrane protein
VCRGRQLCVCQRGDVSPRIAKRQRATAPVHAHSHSHAEPPPTDPSLVQALWTAVAVCALATVIALIALWPGGSTEYEDPMLLDAEPLAATVTVADVVPCSYDATVDCRLIGFELDGTPNGERWGSMEHSLDSTLRVGDDIKVTAFVATDGQITYSFFDYQRGPAMFWLVGMFVAAVLALGRWRGLGALSGLAFSLVVIVVFTLPAVLNGSNAVAVALVTASLIAFAALFLAHGFELATAVALLSTFASLVITAVLASLFVGAAHLTGLTDDSSIMLAGLAGPIDPRGILLAGVVIGALGVLDDVTVTQVSVVWELKRVQPALGVRELVGPALRIGRDHISSTVNTLFLAYAGAALPLLLLFTEAGQDLTDVITREIVAIEVVRALIGSVGLVASVPITTWLAAVVVTSGGATEPRRKARGHAAADGA